MVYAAMFASGAHCIAFDIMVQTGENLLSLFKRPTDKQIVRGDLVMMDHGCRINDYCSDSARTIVFGDAPKAKIELLEKLNRVFEAGLNEICAGMTGHEADAVIRAAAQKEGDQLGLTADELLLMLRTLIPRTPEMYQECCYTLRPMKSCCQTTATKWAVMQYR